MAATTSQLRTGSWQNRTHEGGADRAVWGSFTADTPGERFVRLRERRQEKRKGYSLFDKCVNVLGGSFLVILGLILIPTPGPGVLTIALGMALLGTEFLIIARCMDTAEMKARAHLGLLQKCWVAVRDRRRGSMMSEARA
jgi:hypothetical protein